MSYVTHPVIIVCANKKGFSAVNVFSLLGVPVPELIYVFHDWSYARVPEALEVVGIPALIAPLIVVGLVALAMLAAIVTVNLIMDAISRRDQNT